MRTKAEEGTSYWTFHSDVPEKVVSTDETKAVKVGEINEYQIIEAALYTLYSNILSLIPKLIVRLVLKSFYYHLIQ